MKKFYGFALMTVVALLFTACSSSVSKKILIIGKGEIVVKDNNVTMKDKAGYAEQSVDIFESEAVTWNVQTPSGKTTVTIPADQGLYILNLRVDTLVGSKQVFGQDISNNSMITQEKLKLMIDSLTLLTSGANVSAGGSNYMIAPNQVQKISANTDAKVYGPFTKIPGKLEAGKDGKAPEIYKFYTNTEMRQLIKNFTEMTH